MGKNEGQNDIYILEKPQDVRLIYSEKHNKVLKLVMENELSISEIAKILHQNPGSIHYYLKELERHGLVKQVREEVKGGVVKKYYRSVAKRILLDSPDFNEMKRMDIDPDSEYLDQLIQSFEYLGYYLPPENREDAKDLLFRYNKRTVALLDDIEDGEHHRDVPPDITKVVFRAASEILLNLRSMTDPELGRISREFGKLFLPYE